MVIRGLILPDNVRYIKFHKSPSNRVDSHEVGDGLIAMDIYCEFTENIEEYECIKNFPIEHDDFEYIKLPVGNPHFSLITPDFSINSKIFSDLEVNIVIVRIDHECIQVDGNDEDVHNTLYFLYDRITILLREDKRTVRDLQKLFDGLGVITLNPIHPDAEVGNILRQVVRRNVITCDYYSTTALDLNGTISTLDWSHATEKFLDLIHQDLKEFDFNEPLTKLQQELPENRNLIRYDFSELQPDGRGHLIGEHWKYFYMHKMPFDLEFIVTQTSYYVRLLHLMQSYLKVTNIASFYVTDNLGMEWNVAVEWNLPFENNFDLNDPKGSSDTVGQVIRISGILHFNTVGRAKLMELAEGVLLTVNNESEIINKKSV